ncbi:hypothetical protein BH23BAC1_BH23BAC1_20390 [soil metagenome]
MILLIFIIIVFFHGLIHLLGFLKEFDLAKIDELSGKTLIPLSEHYAKIAGVFWFISCILFMASLLLLLMKKEWWWMLGVAAVFISQLLIIVYWQDAKFGTITNIIVFGGILIAFGSWNFKNDIKDDLKSFTPADSRKKEIISHHMLFDLPYPVQKWLQRSQIIGKNKINTVHLFQSGSMKIKPEGSWIPVRAEQYFTVDTPGFLWIADVKASPFIPMVGKDKYLAGNGHMEIKALSLIPVVNSRGKEIDQGTMVRFLAEMIWFPSAALNNYITWEEIDDYQAKAIFTYGDISASGIFIFNEEGDVVGFEAQRYYNRKEGATLETWYINIDPDSIQEFEGIKIPVRSEVTWKFKEGDFTWYKLEISNVEYNKNINFFPESSGDLVLH